MKINHSSFHDMHRKERRWQWSKLVFALTILFCLNGDGFCIAAASKYEQGWVLCQSSNFGGTLSSEFTDNALKMYVGRLGLTLITKAPKWNALVFNESSKTYVDLPYKSWQKKFILGSKNNSSNMYAGPAFKVHNTGKTMRIDNFRTYECLAIRRADPNKKLAEESMTQLWLSSDIKAPRQIEQIFCSQLGIPVHMGIPLGANRSVNGKMVSILKTLSVKRRPLAVSTFNSLTGYRQVKDEFELVTGESSKDAIENLLDEPISPEKKK